MYESIFCNVVCKCGKDIIKSASSRAYMTDTILQCQNCPPSAPDKQYEYVEHIGWVITRVLRSCKSCNRAYAWVNKEDVSRTVIHHCVDCPIKNDNLRTKFVLIGWVVTKYLDIINDNHAWRKIANPLRNTESLASESTAIMLAQNVS